ncbi:hypothetical protein [Deinococcus apachensis]|uniref:hypothetical protein n=1 Tax=Deinococcus apachensis TaxID=309886 RepID=UPI00037D3968|nr:hypothetical protein [Deinococcus apachensis]
MGVLDDLRIKLLDHQYRLIQRMIHYRIDPVTGDAVPSAGGACTATYPPQVLTVSTTEVGLTVPNGANRALVSVNVGSARMGYSNAATASVQSSVNLKDAQLTALRLIRDGASDATVRVDYWREE